MERDKPPASNANAPTADRPRESPLSLNRLREAFATMLGDPAAKREAKESQQSKAKGSGTPPSPLPLPPCEISPRSVVESLLFVGRPDNGPISARELAAAMRGVSPKEIDAAVSELNATYDADQAPYCIEQSTGGYRLILRPELERMRDKFYGKVKEARLTPTAIEVLSVLAYNQPATVDQLNELRDSPCGAALATLVRRKLVRVDRPAEPSAAPQYSTTERFLQLFRLDSLDALPRSEELDRV